LVSLTPSTWNWELIGRCVGAAFEAQESTPQARVTLLEDLGTLDKNKAQIIWAVLQCRVMVNRFVEVDFRVHVDDSLNVDGKG
jgi:hypothetical protein